MLKSPQIDRSVGRVLTVEHAAQPLQPGQLVLVVVVVEGPAVGHVHRRDPHPAARRPQQPGLGVRRRRRRRTRRPRRSSPTRLRMATPFHRPSPWWALVVAERLEGQRREGVVGQLGLLQAQDVGLVLGQPLLDPGEAGLQRVHVPGGDAHRLIVATGPPGHARPTIPCPAFSSGVTSGTPASVPGCRFRDAQRRPGRSARGRYTARHPHATVLDPAGRLAGPPRRPGRRRSACSSPSLSARA